MADESRIVNDIENMRVITDPCEGGTTRIGFTEKYREGAEYFKGKMREAGLAVREDSIGNVYGRLAGTEDTLPVILAGSHLDTVRNAGAYDGIAGAVCALEAARMIKENHIKLKHPFEVVGIIEEEGTKFGQVLLGSKFVTGAFSESDMDSIKDEDGITLRNVLSAYQAADCCGCYRESNEVLAFLELHDEQGPLLESRGIDIGIVEKIVAISWLTVTVTGFAGHAGTIPMPLRQDAATGASYIIGGISSFTTEKYSYQATATVGKLELLPGSANCIPGKCTFSVDLRAGSFDVIDDIIEYIHKLSKECEALFHVNAEVMVNSRQAPIAMNLNIRQVYQDCCEKLGYSYCSMNSGAGHDSMIFSAHWPAAMFFIPCRKGITHNPEEYVTPQALAKGADLLYESILAIDKME